jgi:hypothetical protein
LIASLRRRTRIRHMTTYGYGGYDGGAFFAKLFRVE